jgi:hypothetical protein
MKKIFLLVSCTMCLVISVVAQNVGIGTTTPHASAALEVNSSDKGFLVSRLTTIQRNAIASPATGLLVFDTDFNALFMYNGQQWAQLGTVSSFTSPPVDQAAVGLAYLSNLGTSTSMYGNYTVVGCDNDTIMNGAVSVESGSAYVYEKLNGSWVLRTKIRSGNAFAGGGFGKSVGIWGDFIVVGAPNEKVGANNGQGRIYIFKRNGINWALAHTFVTGDGAANDRFGWSVAIDSVCAMGGAFNATVGGAAGKGAVYSYLRNTTTNNWAFQVKLTSTDALAGDQFGTSIDIDKDYCIIGAPWDTENAIARKGSAYVFVAGGGTWTQQQKIVEISYGTEFFGQSVAISGDNAVIGAPGTAGTTDWPGSAFIYTRSGSTWSYIIRIYPEVNYIGKRSFGYSVAMSNDVILIGAPSSDEEPLQGKGLVFIYQLVPTQGWFLRDQISSTQNNWPNQFFGNSVSLYNKDYIISAPYKKPNGAVSFGRVE